MSERSERKCLEEDKQHLAQNMSQELAIKDSLLCSRLAERQRLEAQVKHMLQELAREQEAAISERSKLQVMQNQLLELHQELDDERVRFQQAAQSSI